MNYFSVLTARATYVMCLIMTQHARKTRHKIQSFAARAASLCDTLTRGDKEEKNLPISFNSVAKQLVWEIIREIQILQREDTFC